MPIFTEEIWKEIYASRAQLEAYKNKTQPYPPYPPSPYQGEVELEPVFRPRPVDKEIDQLKAGFLFLQAKVNELQAGKRDGGVY